MGWVDGKPKMVSERYVGTAADIEALLDAREEQMLPERTRHLDFGAVAAAWGLLADLGVAAVIDEETGARPPGLPLSPGTYLALAALNRVVDPCSKRGVRGLVAHHGGGPVHQDPGLGAGSPPVLGRDARGAAGRAAADRGEAGAGGVRPVRAGHQLGGAGHDELRDVHRYRQRQGADRAAGQGQAETRRPAAGRPRAGGHPGRRRPAAVPCLPREQARRHPVPADDHGPGRPARRPGRRGRAGRHRDDRRLRRRAELRGQLRAAGRHEPALRGVGARQ